MNSRQLLTIAAVAFLAFSGLTSCTKSKEGLSLSDSEIFLIAMAAAPSYQGCQGSITVPAQIQPGAAYKYSIASGQSCIFSVNTTLYLYYTYSLSSEWGNQPLYVAATCTPSGPHATDVSGCWSSSATDSSPDHSLYLYTSMAPTYVEVDGFIGVFSLSVNP